MAGRPNDAAANDALAALVEWLDAWQRRDWHRMAELTSTQGADTDSTAAILARNFRHRLIDGHDVPTEVHSAIEDDEDFGRIGEADFAVSVDLDEGRGPESFIARVQVVGRNCRVNAASTMSRRTAPRGRG